YERGAGDKIIPSDLRPPEVLKKTLDYLFHDLIEKGGFSETYAFIRDRSRQVRVEFSIQQEIGPIAIECHDRCARFHILALHLERKNPAFSVQMEHQQLSYTLISLLQFYDDMRGNYSSPTELEMRVYHRLIQMRDQKERAEHVPDAIKNHPVFKLTTRFRARVQIISSPITKTSSLKLDAGCMEIFAELAAVLRQQNNVVMIYLVACLLEFLFGEDAIDNIEAIRGDLTIPEIIDGISRPLPSTNGTPSAVPETSSLDGVS
ncbi:SAC3/GANP/Nin1/mts3/eIF-3 p25 family-domain-containing protein, partial [Abortiporus biennis]